MVTNGNTNNNLLDAAQFVSLYVGILNLIENRQQSAQNDIQAANDKQAKYLLNHLHEMFEDQNKKIDRILEILEESHEGN